MTEIHRYEPNIERQGASLNAAWSSIMAVLYDPFLWLGEIVGMRRRKRTLLSEAHGLVVEIGAGTGLNVSLYPDAIDELMLAEPEPEPEPDLGMRGQLARRLDRNGRSARISDASVETVVATLVLCTVAEPGRALREIARLLRPHGAVAVHRACARAPGSSRRFGTESSNRGATSKTCGVGCRQSCIRWQLGGNFGEHDRKDAAHQRFSRLASAPLVCAYGAMSAPGPVRTMPAIHRPRKAAVPVTNSYATCPGHTLRSIAEPGLSGEFSKSTMPHASDPAKHQPRKHTCSPFHRNRLLRIQPEPTPTR